MDSGTMFLVLAMVLMLTGCSEGKAEKLPAKKQIDGRKQCEADGKPSAVFFRPGSPGGHYAVCCWPYS